MRKTLSEKLTIYGERAYLGAWALEVIASITGLATGIALAFRGYKDADAANFTEMDFVLASAPYFMVAIAELTKIPIATLLFHVRWLWKPVVLLFLLGMAAITFETVYAGLDRALTLRKDRYDTLVQQITVLKDEDSHAARRMADGVGSDQLKKAKENNNDLVAQSTVEHNNLTSQLVEVEHELQGQRTVSPEASRLADTISAKSAEREKVVAEREKFIKNSVDEFERQRQSFDDRLKLAQERNDTEAIRRYQAQEDALANPRPKIEKEYSLRVEALEKDLVTLNVDFDRKQAQSAPMSQLDRQKLEAKRDDLRGQISNSDKKWQSRLSQANSQMNDALTLQSDGVRENITIDKRRQSIGTELDRLERERIQTARLDQIRRIAARFYAAKPEDVTNDKVDFISNIWFGSLALLAALAGPMTALVSLELQKLGDEGIRNKKAGLLRRLLVSWRWRRIRTVKVPVEIPVEREVEKRVEVTVEKIIKEIMYVPIFTDDPEALRRAMDQSLDKDIADHLKFSLAGLANGNTAQYKAS